MANFRGFHMEDLSQFTLGKIGDADLSDLHITDKINASGN